MKLSNFLLSIVTVFLFGIAVSATQLVIPMKPTSVINIPQTEGVQGNGFSVKVPTDLTHEQSKILAMAYEIAKKDGHKHPEILQGIVLQESRAGAMENYKVANTKGDPYYGVCQIKVAATKEVLAAYPELWEEFKFQTHTDQELIANLILNTRFNLTIASKYLLILHNVYGVSGYMLPVAFNKGAAGSRGINPDEDEYNKSVNKHINNLKHV
jgi:hypothetical protein